jgi:hypothetical protein
VDQYTRPQAPTLSFGQKLARGLGKFAEFALPIAGAVSAVAFPGPGFVGAAAAFGASRGIGDALRKSEARDQVKQRAYENYQAPVQIPGFFDVSPSGQPLSTGPTDFMAPTAYPAQVEQTLELRNQMHQNAISSFP